MAAWLTSCTYQGTGVGERVRIERPDQLSHTGKPKLTPALRHGLQKRRGYVCSSSLKTLEKECVYFDILLLDVLKPYIEASAASYRVNSN